MISVEELAALVDGTVEGDGTVGITGAASVEDACSGDIVLAESDKYFQSAAGSDASAIVASKGDAADKPVIKVKNAKLAFAKILKHFSPETRVPLGVDSTARIGKNVSLGQNVAIGYGCYIGDNVTIGDEVVLHPQVYIGDGAKIGSGTVLWPQVVVQWGCEIGSRVAIHSGSVIGTDGFGYVTAGGRHEKIPQIGKVIIEDDVEIGANVTIDRAKTGATIVGRGTKIDNLVMVAHNVRIGANCIIVAQVGFAGSVNVGDGVLIAGQSGVKDHVSIGENTIISARTGVVSDVPPGSVLYGFPARSRSRHLRIEASLERLPDLVRTVKKLEEKLDQLQGQK